MVTKQCKICEADVQVEEPTGHYAGLLKRLGVMCDECADREDEATRAEEEAARAARERELLVARVKTSGLPDELRSVMFSSLPDIDDNNRAGIEAAKKWAAGEPRGLILAGPVGAGKTWTAAAAANAYLRTGERLAWFAVSAMIARAQAGFDNPARDELYNVLLDPRRALVLDDLTYEFKPHNDPGASPFVKQMLFQAIDERINYGASLLITTNLSYPEIVRAYGERIASRLKGNCLPVRMEGDDRRSYGK